MNSEDRETLETDVLIVGAGPAGLSCAIRLADLCTKRGEKHVVPPGQPLPQLPVARAVWVPRPNLKVAASTWIYGGGSHHTGFSQALSAEHLADFAEMVGIEFLRIDNSTRLEEFRKELRWNDAYYFLKAR